MYAIRSYYASIGWTKRPEPISAEDQEDIAAMADLVSGISPTAEFQFTSRYGDKSGVTRIMSVSVITSYSIHYTKLYEPAVRGPDQRH